MNILANILGKEVSGILQNLTGFVDKLVVTKEEKAKIIQEITNAENQIQLQIQQTITERHQTVMNSDSWLSKNVRPMVLLAIIVLFLFLSFFDGANWLNVPEGYISILKNWGELTFMFYFGSRGIEKIVNNSSLISKELFRHKKTIS
ncbi:MAG: hypothetical protein DRJ05_00965 [Bacteroidetes bacterium]|nr:MAG: hypothetical protein DRI89_08785 [Bacteroidota bacterium]RLD62183.1 MAG: hypothetical protein DRJ05_00965 [Bacteroidota bacterium]